ncbi:hypothetical protein GP486_001546 [Trichoglossum hirsutum]|uniref:DUF1754-domain-containing protein n=1 Tax=Trichoglossum hirsutum TaxID=265104 RepID=A0A9P8LGN0_9PEZI|nr:hypothetical protein GP486_001546 [Trichoglossum hirsutum]
MGGDEYAAAGGSLKLKGVKDSKVDKKRKKKKAAKVQPENETDGDQSSTTKNATTADESGGGSAGASDGREASAASSLGKTEAERRHEEMRRKRLDERLKREGSKTHKERVEELNKYLSNLSEHHDIIFRIGGIHARAAPPFPCA